MSIPCHLVANKLFVIYYFRLPGWPSSNPRAYRLKGPVSPAPPAFGQDLFYPPCDSYPLVRGNDLAIVGNVRAPRNTRVNDLERGGVSGLECDIADDFTHLLRG